MMYWWCLGDDKFILYEKTKFKKKYHLNVTKYKVYKKFIKSHWEVRWEHQMMLAESVVIKWYIYNVKIKIIIHFTQLGRIRNWENYETGSRMMKVDW